MAINNKGMIFTVMVISILSFFLVAYSGYEIIQDRKPIEKRIDTLNSFVSSVETDIPRHLYISGYRTIFVLQQYTIDQHQYITNFSDSVNEVFFNGSLYGEQKALMDDGKFSDILYSLNSNANKINAQVYLLNPRVNITQEDPWNIKITLNTTIIVEDKTGLAKWNRSATFESLVPIENFIDPIYNVETSGKVATKLQKTPYSIFVSGSNYSNLTNHFQNSYFVESSSAPNFLKRLQGDFSADVNGIESIVYPQELSDMGIFVKYKSLIDYIYFSDSNPQAYSVPGVSNLILDNQSNHLYKYNVSSMAVPI